MMKNQLAGLMKQAQAMQDNLKRAQDELATLEVEGQSGAGLVKVVMTCKHDVRRVAIDLLAEDKDMLDVRRRVDAIDAPRPLAGQADRGAAAAAGHEAASDRPRRSTRSMRCGLPGVGQRSARHGVPAAARPRRRAPGWR